MGKISRLRSTSPGHRSQSEPWPNFGPVGLPLRGPSAPRWSAIYQSQWTAELVAGKSYLLDVSWNDGKAQTRYRSSEFRTYPFTVNSVDISFNNVNGTIGGSASKTFKTELPTNYWKRQTMNMVLFNLTSELIKIADEYLTSRLNMMWWSTCWMSMMIIMLLAEVNPNLIIVNWTKWPIKLCYAFFDVLNCMPEEDPMSKYVTFFGQFIQFASMSLRITNANSIILNWVVPWLHTWTGKGRHPFWVGHC